MIRQAIPSDSNSWVLISQIQHAEFSAILASHWKDWKFARPQNVASEDTAFTPRLKGLLLEAIRHHDDGWRNWDQHPPLDPSGIPLSFSEQMPADSHAIWHASIAGVAPLGPLAQWIVAEHFLAFRRPKVDHDNVYREFVDRVEPLTDRWRSAIQSDWGFDAAFLNELRHVLPFFDALSLRLCCTPWQSFEIVDWNQRRLKFRPADNADLQTHEFSADPWPFDVPELVWNASGWLVPRSLTAKSPPSFLTQPMAIRWRLRS